MTTDIKALMAAKLGKKEATFAANPHWQQKDGYIADVRRGEIFDVRDYDTLLLGVKEFFKSYYDSFKAESQVVVVTSEDKAKFRNKYLPEIHIDDIDDLHVIVLPQENVWGNTVVSEAYWQNELVAQGITPVFRIHSHHVLEAYQSSTDWSSLNSGTMEMVLGHIYDEQHHIAYWLDVRGTNNKDTVYRTVDNGDTINIVPCGKPEPIKPFDIQNANQ